MSSHNDRGYNVFIEHTGGVKAGIMLARSWLKQDSQGLTNHQDFYGLRILRVTDLQIYGFYGFTDLQIFTDGTGGVKACVLLPWHGPDEEEEGEGARRRRRRARDYVK